MANDVYEVTGQEAARLIGTNGRATRGVIVTFRSKASDVTGELEVPADQFTAENVDTLIRERVAQIDAVHAL